MTNREVLIKSLQDDEADEYTVDFIKCVNAEVCDYDGGSDDSPCIECKVKWLEEEWSD